MRGWVLTSSRPETESYTSYLSSLLTNASSHYRGSKLRILDLCTGTGCIPLLLHSRLFPDHPDLELVGVDISPAAINLAKENLEWNVQHRNLDSSARTQVTFLHGDVLDPKYTIKEDYDIVISNPPYISPRDFATDTQRSVRNFEPRLALVPPPKAHAKATALLEDDEGDVFYPRILHIAEATRAKMVLMEVDGMKQAQRAATMTRNLGRWGRVQIWRDDLEETRWTGHGREEEKAQDPNAPFLVLGDKRERAVFATSSLNVEG